MLQKFVIFKNCILKILSGDHININFRWSIVLIGKNLALPLKKRRKKTKTRKLALVGYAVVMNNK